MKESRIDEIDSDDCPSDQAISYDIIGFADSDDGPYVSGVRKILEFWNKDQEQQGNQMNIINVDQAMKDKELLAIDIEVYINDQRRHAILIITKKVVVMMYKKGNPVINPIKVDEFQSLYLAQNVPSGAALQFTEATEARLRLSHVILESPSMGLLMRYVLEKDFPIEIDFTDEIEYEKEGQTKSFFFTDMVKWRQQELNEFSSGHVRSVEVTRMMEAEIFHFSANQWHTRTAVVTNIGVFIFDQKNLATTPKFFSYHLFVIELQRDNYKLDDYSNILTLGNQEGEQF